MRAGVNRFLSCWADEKPAEPKEYKAVVELARSKTDKAIEVLEHIALNGKNEAARVRAAQALLERAWGKPIQPVMTPDNRPLEEMTDAELLALVRDKIRIGVKDQLEAQVGEPCGLYLGKIFSPEEPYGDDGGLKLHISQAPTSI